MLFMLCWSMISPEKPVSTFSGSCSAFQPGFQKIANHRRFDVGSDHGAADRREQDEGEPSALDLLVLRHQRHQRVGIAKPFLGKSGDVLQMGRQTDLGKMTPDARGIR